MAYVSLQPFAQMMVFAVVGDWFVESLHMSFASLGFNIAVIGLAELAGSTSAALFSDRFGKRHMALFGLAIATPMVIVLGTGGRPRRRRRRRAGA